MTGPPLNDLRYAPVVALRKNFFSRVQMIFCAAAALPPSLWVRLEKRGIEDAVRRVRMTLAWAVFPPAWQAGEHLALHFFSAFDTSARHTS